MRLERDRGAAAVEFALVAVLLVTLLVGIMEFGRLWAIQGSLAQAARDGARTAAITGSDTAGKARLEESFRPLGGAAGDGLGNQLPQQTGTVGQPNCEWSVQPTYEVRSLTGFIGEGWTVSARGTMRCDG